MGDLYRSWGITHQIVVGAPERKFRWLVGGMVNDRASILYEGLLPSIAVCGKPLRTGYEAKTVPSRDQEATNADTESYEATAMSKDGGEE
jgi:hypothetical protein